MPVAATFKAPLGFTGPWSAFILWKSSFGRQNHRISLEDFAKIHGSFADLSKFMTWKCRYEKWRFSGKCFFFFSGRRLAVCSTALSERCLLWGTHAIAICHLLIFRLKSVLLGYQVTFGYNVVMKTRVRTWICCGVKCSVSLGNAGSSPGWTLLCFQRAALRSGVWFKIHAARQQGAHSMFNPKRKSDLDQGYDTGMYCTHWLWGDIAAKFWSFWHRSASYLVYHEPGPDSTAKNYDV